MPSPCSFLVVVVFVAALALMGTGVCASSSSSKFAVDNNSTQWGLLSAPWTPMLTNGSVNLAIIPALAKFQVEQKATMVWVSGCFGQFPQLSTDARKSLFAAWVKYGQPLGLEIICHVGSNDLSEAIELAQYAESIGADAVSQIPPTYPSPPASFDILMDCLYPVANATSLPWYYYHIPAVSNVDFPMLPMVQAAANGTLANFAGIKYVNEDLDDYAACLQVGQQANPDWKIMWAPEPKLQSLPFGATNFVLAEAYYGPWLLNVLDAFYAGDSLGALTAQTQLSTYQSIVGGANRQVMKMFGLDMGPPLLPLADISATLYSSVMSQLSQAGFFKFNNTRYW